MKLSEQKRQHILQAAEQLFYEQGLEHTSMDQIALEAKASKRTVYNHFATKEALFQAITLRMQQQFDNTAAVTFDSKQAIESQLLAIAQQEVALLSSPAFLRSAKITLIQLVQQPDLAKQLDQKKVGCISYMERFLQDANTAGVLNIDDLELAAKQFVYQLKSLIFYPRLYGFEPPTPSQQDYLVEQTIAMFLARYQAQPSS